MSSTEHPLDKSCIGFFNPCSKGPHAEKFPNFSVILYAILPASRLGKIKTFAIPSTGEFGAFILLISGTIAASNCNSRSSTILGYFFPNIEIAFITFSTL